MSDWPKAVRDEDFIAAASFDDERHFLVVPADLARELYEAGRDFLAKLEEGLTKREQGGTPVAETAAAAEIRFRAALARYEREGEK